MLHYTDSFCTVTMSHQCNSPEYINGRVCLYTDSICTVTMSHQCSSCKSRDASTTMAGCVILISACDSTCIYIDDTCDSTVIFRTFWLPIYISCFDSLSHYKVECQREHIYLTQHYIIAIFVFGTIWKCHRNNQTDKSRGM